jgi:hypothetical protein
VLRCVSCGRHHPWLPSSDDSLCWFIVSLLHRDLPFPLLRPERHEQVQQHPYTTGSPPGPCAADRDARSLTALRTAAETLPAAAAGAAPAFRLPEDAALRLYTGSRMMVSLVRGYAAPAVDAPSTPLDNHQTVTG